LHDRSIMNDRVEPGIKVLMPAGAFANLYAVAIVELVADDVIIGREVAPNQGARQLEAPLGLVRTLGDFARKEPKPEVTFPAGDTVLQQVDGGFQIVTVVHDILPDSKVVMLRTYVRQGANLMGIDMASPADALVDPRIVLE
jgi:hypothetical protein